MSLSYIFCLLCSCEILKCLKNINKKLKLQCKARSNAGAGPLQLTGDTHKNWNFSLLVAQVELKYYLSGAFLHWKSEYVYMAEITIKSRGAYSATFLVLVTTNIGSLRKRCDDHQKLQVRLILSPGIRPHAPGWGAPPACLPGTMAGQMPLDCVEAASFE